MTNSDFHRSAVNASEPRFFIDHGMIHDRLTGKHVTTEPDSAFCDGIAKCCDLLNSLAERREPRVFPLLFDSNWLEDKSRDEPQAVPVTQNAAALAERLIQAAVDYEAGRCSKRELAEARAAVETAIQPQSNDSDYIEKLKTDIAFCREAMRHSDIVLSTILPMVDSDIQKEIRKTLARIDEAKERSLSLTRPQSRTGKICGYSDGCPPDGPVCHLCAHLQPGAAK